MRVLYRICQRMCVCVCVCKQRTTEEAELSRIPHSHKLTWSACSNKDYLDLYMLWAEHYWNAYDTFYSYNKGKMADYIIELIVCQVLVLY